MSTEQADEKMSRARLPALGLLALSIMVPVTLPVPVLRELVQERFGVSELQTSLFMSINMIGALLAAPLAGAVVDRFGRRRLILVAALLVDAACFAGLTAASAFPQFLWIRLLEGCAHITALSILLSLASHALPQAQRGRAMGVVGASMMFGVALGAPIGGALGASGPLAPLQAGTILLLVAASLAAIFVREDASRDERPGFGEILRALRQHPALVAPLVYAFIDRFTVGFFTTTFSLYLRRIHELSSTQIGLAIAVFMIPFALLSYPFGRAAERYSISLLMAGGSVLYGIGTMMVGFAAPPALQWLMLAIGVTAAVMFVPSMVMTTHLVPDSVRSTALGAFNAAGSLGFIIGPITGGLVSTLVAASWGWPAGYQAAFCVAGLSELVCVLATLPLLLRLRREGRIS